MSKLLEKLERKLATLPQEAQQQWVQHFLKELDVEAGQIGDNGIDERQWINGQPPAQKQVTAAVEQLRRFRKGKQLGTDTTLNDLIDEGRRF